MVQPAISIMKSPSIGTSPIPHRQRGWRQLLLRARSGRFLADDFVRGEGSAQTWPPLGEILGKSGRKCGMNDMP